MTDDHPGDGAAELGQLLAGTSLDSPAARRLRARTPAPAAARTRLLTYLTEDDIGQLLARAAASTALPDSAGAVFTDTGAVIAALDRLLELAAGAPMRDPGALAAILRQLREADAGALVAAVAQRAAVHLEVTDAAAVAGLLELLAELGQYEQGAALARRAARHTGLDAAGALARLLRALDRLGPPDALAAVLERDPAAHADASDPAAVADLIAALRYTGAPGPAVRLLARRAARMARFTDWAGFTTLIPAMASAGLEDDAIELAARRAWQAGVIDPDAVADLLPEQAAEQLRGALRSDDRLRGAVMDLVLTALGAGRPRADGRRVRRLAGWLLDRLLATATDRSFWSAELHSEMSTRLHRYLITALQPGTTESAALVDARLFDVEAARAAVEEFEAGVEQALRTSTRNLPVIRAGDEAETGRRALRPPPRAHHSALRQRANRAAEAPQPGRRTVGGSGGGAAGTTTLIEGAGTRSAFGDDLARAVADQVESFLAAVRAVARGEAGDAAVPMLLLEVSTLLLTGARLGAIATIANEYSVRPGAEELGRDTALTALRERFAAILDPCDNYREVYDPLAMPTEVETRRVSDDLTAIAAELAHGLTRFREGRESEALWRWQASYLTGWGPAATMTLRALQSIVAGARLSR